MSSNQSLIKKHSVSIYFFLTFILSWGCMSLMISPYSFPLTPEQSDAVGPMLYVGMLIGPSVAGLISIVLMHGRVGLRDLFCRLTKWRVGIKWYAAALLSAPLLATMMLMILSLYSPVFTPAVFTTDDTGGLIMMGVGIGIMVGMFEEIGWTGFVVHQLRKRYDVNSVGLIVGLLWGAWHFPPFWGTNTFSGVLPVAILLGQLFVWLPAYRTLMVRLYDQTKSLLVTILMHASLVFTTLTFPSMELAGLNLLIWLVAWGLVLWGAVVIINSRLFQQL
jgi:membrane protease YdiL (CAAX protease family)